MNLLSFSLVAIGFQESIRKCRECEEIMRNGGLYRLQNKRSSGCGYKDSGLISYASWEGNMSAWVYMQKCLVVWYLILYKNLAIYIYKILNNVSKNNYLLIFWMICLSHTLHIYMLGHAFSRVQMYMRWLEVLLAYCTCL